VKVAVLGAGSWGTALASVLASNQHDTWLWARRNEVADEINRENTNRRYLPDAKLPPNLHASADVQEVLTNASLVIVSVPSSSILEACQIARPHLPSGAIVAHAVKGFDHVRKRRMSTVLEEELGVLPQKICVISGPSHAEEVVAKLPTTIVVSSVSRSTAEMVQDTLMNPYLRVYTNPDVVGTEMGGSLKNIIALGVGIADGLGFGDNAKAALMTRGLAEIARLGMAMGASPLTFAGLSGIGDLIVTCTSRHSRNFRTGRLLGQGLSLQDALSQVGMAVEGIPTTRVTVELALELGVEMPITKAIHGLLFEGKSPAQAVEELMGRARNHEVEEVAHYVQAPQWQP
jgi:glycerol-3-phosphate dehydrogenase (NAD(P)+)